MEPTYESSRHLRAREFDRKPIARPPHDGVASEDVCPFARFVPPGLCSLLVEFALDLLRSVGRNQLALDREEVGVRRQDVQSRSETEQVDREVTCR